MYIGEYRYLELTFLGSFIFYVHWLTNPCGTFVIINWMCLGSINCFSKLGMLAHLQVRISATYVDRLNLNIYGVTYVAIAIIVQLKWLYGSF